MNSDSPIGIFDSGIGGLTVFKVVSEVLPLENLIYLGDTARVPYGPRSAETIARYSFECTDFLIRKGIKILVVACNTVSATSLEGIRERVSIPVIGVILPGARAAVAATMNRRVGVVGTEATISSGAYTKAIKALDAGIEVFGLACPLFVPLAEEGWTDGEIARLVAERYLAPLRGNDIDTIVLGCTHYPLLKDVIGKVMSGSVIIDSAAETEKALKAALDDGRLLRTRGGAGTHRFFVTDSAEKFKTVGGRFLGEEIRDIEIVNVPSSL
jgi:glutamate racemase